MSQPPQGDELRNLMGLQSDDPPAVQVLNQDGSFAWSVGYDGTVILGPGCSPDEASRAFWQGVSKNAPGIGRIKRRRLARRYRKAAERSR